MRRQTLVQRALQTIWNIVRPIIRWFALVFNYLIHVTLHFGG